MLAELAELHVDANARKDAFSDATTARREAMADAFRDQRDALFDDVLAGAPRTMADAVRGYAHRTDWALLDLVALAACSPLTPDAAGRLVAPRAFLYQALRMLDDAVDDHDTYKGGERTLLGELRTRPSWAPPELAGTLVPMTMMVVHACTQLDAEDVALAQRTLGGMLVEATPRDWTVIRYRELVEAKMVSYGMLLYRPVALSFDEPALTTFLARSFFVSQL